MKTYFIYKRNEGLTPTLYAITNEKEYSDRFLKERNTKIFVLIEKSMDKKEYMNFLARHSGFKLGINKFKTKNKDNDSIQIVSVLSTNSEYLGTFTRMDEVYLELGKYVTEYAKSFNEEILKALKRIGYFDIYKFKCEKDYFVDCIVMSSSADYFEFPLSIDEFELFLYLYSWSFKK